MRSTHYRARNTIAAISSVILLSALGASASVLPPDPNDAALLYYQAVLACPPAEDSLRDALNRVLAGAEPSEAVKEYVANCEQAIRLVEAAGKTPACDWDITDASGESPFANLAVKVQTLALVLGAEAAMNASSGDYRTALRRCVLMCRAASHGGGTQPNPLAVIFEGTAHRVVRYVLGLMPPDIETLTWLKRELVSTRVAPPDFVEALRADIEFILRSVASDGRIMTLLRGDILKHGDESMKAEIERMSDGQILDLVCQSQTGFLTEARQIVESNLPYPDVHAQLERLEQKIEKQGKDNPGIALLSITSMGRMAQFYAARVRRQAYANALEVALELYLEAARTGRLPRRLSNNWPRDPLTGEDFDYEITKTGFALRSRNRDIPGVYGVDLELRVSDPNLLRQPEPYEAPTKANAAGSNKEVPMSSEPNDARILQNVGTEAGKKVQYESANDLEAVMHDEKMPPGVRERAKTALTRLRTRWAEGLHTPEPLLIGATLCRSRDEGTALNIIAFDEDSDTAGIRVKEQHVDPNGRSTGIAEDYPAFARGKDFVFDLFPLLAVTIRDKGQRKDQSEWEAYLIDSIDWLIQEKGRETKTHRSYGLNRPPVWVSRPRPGTVRVFVCLYDRQRHESDYVEVEDALDREPFDPMTYVQSLLSPRRE
jgi:hypothetical protein